VGCH
jgi:hypothetical protein